MAKYEIYELFSVSCTRLARSHEGRQLWMGKPIYFFKISEKQNRCATHVPMSVVPFINHRPFATVRHQKSEALSRCFYAHYLFV